MRKLPFDKLCKLTFLYLVGVVGVLDGVHTNMPLLQYVLSAQCTVELKVNLFSVHSGYLVSMQIVASKVLGSTNKLYNSILLEVPLKETSHFHRISQ